MTLLHDAKALRVSGVMGMDYFVPTLLPVEGVPVLKMYAGSDLVWPFPVVGTPMNCPAIPDGAVVGPLNFTRVTNTCHSDPWIGGSGGTGTSAPLATFWGQPIDGKPLNVRITITFTVAVGHEWNAHPTFKERNPVGTSVQVSGPHAPLGPGTHTQVWDMTLPGQSNYDHMPNQIVMDGMQSNDRVSLVGDVFLALMP